MYQASELFKKAILQKIRELRIRVTIDNKVYQDSDIQDCNIEESILTGDEFRFGSSTASKLDLTLINIDDSLSAKSFEQKTAFVEIGVVLEKFSRPFEFVSMGHFVIEEGLKDNNLIKLSGYDKMIYFEKPYVTSLTFPATIKQILQEVCTLAGVELQTTSFINEDLVIDECPDLTDVHLRNALEHISELSCSFASINRTDKLELVTLKDTDTSINADNYYSMNLSEYMYGPIDQISISEKNIFAPYIDQQRINNMLNAVKGFTFKPFTATWQGNPLTSPGDIINVSFKNGEIYKSFIGKQKFNFSTGLKCEVAANAKTVIQSEYQTPGPISKVVESTKKEMRSRFEQVEDRITLEVEAVNESIASIELKADSIEESVKSTDGRVTQLSLGLDSLELSVQGKADADGSSLISLISLAPADMKIQSKNINMIGAVTLSALANDMSSYLSGIDANASSAYSLAQIANGNANTANGYLQMWKAPDSTYINGNYIASGTIQADRFYGNLFTVGNGITNTKLELYTSDSSGTDVHYIKSTGSYGFGIRSNSSLGLYSGSGYPITLNGFTRIKNDLSVESTSGSVLLGTNLGIGEVAINGTLRGSNIFASGMYMNNNLVATQSWVLSQGYSTGSSGNPTGSRLVTTGGYIDSYSSLDMSISGSYFGVSLNGSQRMSVTQSQLLMQGTVKCTGVDTSSDVNLKRDIVDYKDSALQKIVDTPIVSYRYKDEPIDARKTVGIIAQIAPDEVYSKGEDGCAVSIYPMISLAWKAIQELKAENNLLKEEIDILKGVA